MSARAVRYTMIVLALLGAGIAAYLTYAHYGHHKLACSLGSQCETVQHSAYADLAGLPVAVLGLLGYALILAALMLPAGDPTRLVLVALTVVGFGVSAYLTYRELFTIHAICQWCVGSAVIMTVLAALAIGRFVRGDPPEVNTPRGPASDETAGPVSSVGRNP
jgi:uncharacterized membrane protein